MKKPICKSLRTNKNNNFKFTIKFLMTLDRSYIGFLCFLSIDFLKSVLMYSKGAICLSRLLFKMGLFTLRGMWVKDCQHSGDTLSSKSKISEDISMIWYSMYSLCKVCQNVKIMQFTSALSF
jgi:hypothetical protein